MNIRLLRQAALLSLGLCAAMNAVGAPAITVTSMGGNTTFVTGGSGAANFSVKVDGDVQPKNTPLQLYFMDKNGGHYASQITSGVSACTGIPTVCGNPISLSAGQQCCLQLALDGSQLPPKTYILKAFVGTKPDAPNSAYNGQASDLPITVTSQPLTTTLAVDNPTTLPRALSVNCQPSSSCSNAQNAALTGNSRTITIRNTGSNPAYITSVTSSGLATDTNITGDTCANTTIAPGNTCTITIKPGEYASSNCTTGTTPTAGTISVNATNAPMVSAGVVVLSYGCIYKGGYIFSVDDSSADAPFSGNIAGKVVALTDQEAQSPGIIWSSNGNGSTSGDVQYDAIPGIYDNSTTPPDACNGASDGSCNTGVITNFYTPTTTYPLTYYAAGLCKATIAGYSDWYLPAICEMDGATGGSVSCPSGIQNIVSNLPILINGSCSGAQCLAGYYWSSTEFNSGSGLQYNALLEHFSSGGSLQYTGSKFGQLAVRCVRGF